MSRLEESRMRLRDFARANGVTVAFGLPPFALTWSSVYLQDPGWKGGLESFFSLTQATAPAVVSAISAAAIYRVSRAPSGVVASNPTTASTIQLPHDRPTRSMPKWIAPAVFSGLAAIGVVTVLAAVRRTPDPPTVVAVTAPSLTPPSNTTRPQSTPTVAAVTIARSTTTALSTTTVDVPNVFGMGAGEALERLQQAGFAPASYEVCSGSVPQGAVRQVLVRSSQAIAIDKQGVMPGGRGLPMGTALEVKVGSGRPCA